MQRSLSTVVRTLLVAAVPAVLAGQALPNPMPLKYAGPPTTAAITAGDLMTRLYKYADDSMMGREVGTPYHLKAVAYVEAEMRRLGLKPGGDNGSFYQDFPIWSVALDRASSISGSGQTYSVGRDFTPQPGVGSSFADVPTVFIGYFTDTVAVVDSAMMAGKVVLFAPYAPGATPEQRGKALSSDTYRNYIKYRPFAAGSIQLMGDSIAGGTITTFMNPATTLVAPGPGVSGMLMSTPAAERLFGAPLATARAGQTGAPVTLDRRLNSKAGTPGRNVVAILPGTDPVLKNQYLVIGAHSDHVGFGAMPVMREHDSLAVWGKVAIPAGAEGGRNLLTTPITAEEWTKINADIAEMRKIYPPRPDSIRNGADDDGSGSVSLLEIAEQFAKGNVKPKRSILFIWQAGEEKGMWGSGYFMDHPTVPRDSIVAQLNIDMVGRGAASDITGQAKITTPGQPAQILHGGDRYVQLVGSRRLSTELGDLVEKINTDKKHGFTFDYNIDADGHQQNIYCRSDHWSYAKWGVPVVFFTTGGHAEYHQVTDEPQYIRYDHMAALDKLIFDIAAAVADMPKRPVVDKAKPNPAPATQCRQ